METQPEHASNYGYATFPRQFASYRWFKPLLVALLTVVFLVIFQVVLALIATVWSGDVNFLEHVGTSYEDMDVYTGPGALFELGAIAALIPSLALAALIVRDRPFSSYSSSRGGFKWSAFAKCAGVALVIYAVDFVIESFVLPGGMNEVNVLFTAAGLVLCLVLVPLQCFAEEYVFRGLVLQAVGSWTKLPAIGIAVSAVAFAAGHAYNDIGMIGVFCNGIVWGIIVWKTRGLEATCALHTVNNLGAFFMSGLSLVPATSQVDIPSLVLAIVIDLVYLVVILYADRKLGWFAPQGDGVSDFNRKHPSKRDRAAVPEPPRR